MVTDICLFLLSEWEWFQLIFRMKCHVILVWYEMCESLAEKILGFICIIILVFR